jgi:phosphoglycolate phosphatase
MKCMRYSLAVFDLDGTILDTLDDLHISLNFALEKHSLPGRTLDETRAFVGNGIRKLIERAVPVGTSKEMTDEVHKTFTEHYSVHCADHTHPYDGIHELVIYLKSIGMKTAVVSNKADYGVQSLCKKYFDGLFDYCVGEREGVRKKPCPDSVNNVIKTLAESKATTVYIGDSGVDIETAKNAEVPCISVSWGFRSTEDLIKNGAEKIVNTTEELRAELTEA